MTIEQNNELEIELELKHLVSTGATEGVLAKAESKHRIAQCYFQPNLVEFDTHTKDLGITVAGIELHFTYTDKQRRTLLAILDQTPEPTVRLRSMDHYWYFTVKGLSMDEGTLEFEVPLNPTQGVELVPHAFQSLDKVRHMVQDEGYLWEVDVYQGHLKGLVVAELENRSYAVFPPASLPQWVGEDVTMDFRYKNTCLAKLKAGELEALLPKEAPQP